jgi:hypothetical protein
LKRNLINRAFSVAFIAISLLVPMKSFAACAAPAWFAAGWSVGDVVSQSGKDFRLISAGWGPFDPEGAGAGNWVVNANPCVSAGTPPTVTTTDAATVITSTTAFSGGNVTAAGTAAITEVGIAWNTATAPEVSDNKEIDVGNTSTVPFTLTVTGLSAGTKYFFRAYATSADGTGYGANTWFYTGTAGTLTTQAAVDIHCESFTTGATAINEGRKGRECCGIDALGDLESAVLEYGILYGINTTDVSNSTPSVLVGATIKDVHNSNNAASLPATTVERYQEITGLTAGTTYYNQAYATYSTGTYYGTVKTFATSAACDVYYSCAWDADVDNRWSVNADCSTADGDALAVDVDAIAYHRHDWLSAPIADMSADIATEAAARAMTVLPYRIVVQSGGRVVQNNPTYIGGTQLIVEANGQFSHNGTINIYLDGVDSDVQGHVARVSNAGSILVKGAYTNSVDMTGTGEYCVNGTFTQTTTAPGSVNGDYSSPPSLPTTRYVNGNCVGTSTLPIELLSFEVEKENDNVNISWVTGSEINNDYFEVYASADGKVWESIDVVNGAGNSFIVNKYSTIDNDIQWYTLKYYKLKQVDFDGATSFSKVKVVDFSGKGGITHVYDDGQYLHVFYTEIKGSVELSMYDVHSRNIQLGGVLIEGTTSKHMTVKKEALTPGIYFIQLSNSSQTFSYKLYVR